MRAQRLIQLVIGLLLLASFFLSVYGLLPIGELPIYSYMKEALRLMLLGLGVALILYSTVGDRGCWIASVLFGALTMVFFVFGGFIGPFALFFLISAVLAASCVAVYLPKKKAFRVAAIPLLFIFISAFILYGQATMLYMTLNPFDDPRRDEINMRLGWTLCGEYSIDPVPGKTYIIEWNETLRGDERIACYIKIKLTEPHKMVYIHFKYQVLVIPEVTNPAAEAPPGYYAFDHNIGSLLDLKRNEKILEVGGQYFKAFSYKPNYYSDMRAGSEDYTYMNRWDFYVAYMPAEPVPEGFGDYSSILVSLRVDINVIHLV